MMLAHTRFTGTQLNDTSEWKMQYELEEQTLELMKSIGEAQKTRLRCLNDQTHQHARVAISQIMNTQSIESQGMKGICDQNEL